MTTTKLNLKQKLVQIRKSVGVLQKTEKGNKGAMYVDPAVILLKIREEMDRLNVLLTVEIINFKNTQIEAPTSNNPKNTDYLSENTLVYTWHDADGDEQINCPWVAVGSHMQDPSMAFGGGLTYSERYFLLKFFQVPTTKDDPEYLKEKAGVVEYITDEQGLDIMGLIEETKTDVSKLCAHYKIKQISEIPAKHYAQVVSALEAKREAN